MRWLCPVTTVTCRSCRATVPWWGRADWGAWDEEYVANVQSQGLFQPRWCDEHFVAPVEEVPQAWRDAWHNYSDQEFQEMFAHE